MTKKTRIRVARIAAGAIIAGGASLTAAGAASALDLGVNVSVTTDDGPLPGDGTESPAPSDSGLPTAPNTPTSEPPSSEPPSSQPPTSTPPSDEPTEPTGNPTEPTDGPTDSPTGGSTSGSGSTGGNNNDPDGGSSAQEAGTSALTDTGSDTTAQGSGGELAETGAGQTAFLLIGAATMIAGGIAFRVLPRLAGNRGGTVA
ncbi:hypothetical protein OG601_12575 [Streptomyces sp. NBC_01239]|uniref:hypothetical protein n=1 Tax=Streptomyces sp. NBC_01239 TaxID=2903792 RepID=UPI00224D3910|nr:hypothetical protein [Streptomyces sp. NBC_01239]MCX4811451.1 hypothetical protein [Streptomyces sp. NBC_01239]